MRKRFAGISLLGAFVLLLILPAVFVAQRRPNRPAAQPTPTPARNDLKITYRMGTSGQSMETMTMLKGARERSEMKLGYGRDIINITQCDLRRTIQISDSAKKYVVTPMDTEDSTPGGGVAAGGAREPSTRGGVITYTTSAVDTGERKEMFGFQARHVKTSMVIESSPDACSPIERRMETDGWYIDFSFGLNCDQGRVPQMGGMPSQGGCRDRIRFNRQGAARTGYALQETTTVYGPEGRVAFTSTKEVVELSREPLDAALFDVPAGYVETANAQELYGMPSMDSIMSQAKGQTPVNDDGEDNAAPSSNRKAPGSIRVGVVQINNRTDRQISTESLRQRLIGEIEGAGVDAIALNASSASEAEAEAKAKQCDFILYTDVASMKSSAAKKLFGRVAGMGGVDKTEAKIEFKLFAVGDGAARLQSAATAKEEGDDASAGTAVSQEARAVTAEVKRKGRS
ncbi:MAG TPA: hypothetical protein DC047_06500 [Blastocatellia bacterium]|nr:hypothetical protein [Blastocatellia bacterium]